MTTLWVTGANGVLGSAVVRLAVAAGEYDHIVALAHATPSASAPDAEVEWQALDLRDQEAFAQLASARRPDVIINCAAMTNVDGCEREPALARQINAEGPRGLAQIARAADARLLHVSTDYVFPGDERQPGPYAEGDLVRPVSVYGDSKLGGEQAIAAVMGEASDQYLIVRTAIVIGTGPNQRPNFVTWLAKELHAGNSPKIVTDQYNTPTLAEDLASALLWHAAAGTTGIYHAAGPTLLGRQEWAMAIAQRFNLSTDSIIWVTSDSLNQLAQRPLWGGLRCERLLADQARGAPRFLGAIECLSAIDWGLDF